MADNPMTERSYEEAFERLEEIVARLEGGALTLEESLNLFEEGVALARLCQTKLQAAQGRLELFVKQESNGEIITTPFLSVEEES